MRRGTILFLFACSVVVRTHAQHPITLSQFPTQEELTSCFSLVRLGRADLFTVMSSVAARGDSAVPGLRALLFSLGRSPDSMRAIKQYALLALEAVGSVRSFSVVNEAAQSPIDPEVRGVALNSLATSYYDQVIVNEWTPDREIVHTFMRSAGDSTIVRFLQKEIADIAHAGMVNWTGKNSWEKRTGRIRVRTGGTITLMSISEYREFWWRRNHERLHWNVQEGHFELR